MVRLPFVVVAIMAVAVTAARQEEGREDVYELAYQLEPEGTAIDFSPDGRFLAAGSSDRTIRFWDVNDFPFGNVTYALHNVSASYLSFSYDGAYLASGAGNEVQIWQTEDMEHTPPITIPVPCEPDHDTGVCSVNALVFSTVENSLAVYNNWNGILIFDIPSGEIIYTWSDLFGTVAYSPDGRYLACGDVLSQLIFLLDVVNYSPDPVYVFRLPKHAQAYELAFSPDGKHLAAGTSASSLFSHEFVHIFDVGAFSSMDPIYSLDNHDYFVYTLDYSPDGAYLTTGEGDGWVVVYQANETYGHVQTITENVPNAIRRTLYSDRYLAVAARRDSIDIYQLIN